MHDIDRTQMEFAAESYEMEGEQFEFSGQELAHEGGFGEVFSEAQEMELAHELLEVQNEAELNHFLGNLIRSAGSAIGRAVSSPTGQAIGGMLKNVAKQALPMAGTALGGYLGGPMGAKIGGALGGMASRAIGEAEQFEDREFEGARRFVRMAGKVCGDVMRAPAGRDVRSVARSATQSAVRRYAPQLAGGNPVHVGNTLASAPSAANGQNSGRWVRRGNKVILYGL